VSGRSWFAVEGSLEPVDYDGPSFFRFPQAVAEHVIGRYSAPGDWVIDPFCGFGTTLVAAERLGRHAVGCEADDRRAAFSASRLRDRDRVIHGRCEDLTPRQWPPFALLFTSPPYGSFRSGDHDDEPPAYLEDARRLFSGLARLLAPGATVAVEVSQLRHGDRTRPLVWQLGTVLSEVFPLREDLVRVNTGSTQAGPGYDHSHVLIFDVPPARRLLVRQPPIGS
jgi:SAM-dependent methyltransferase